MLFSRSRPIGGVAAAAVLFLSAVSHTALAQSSLSTTTSSAASATSSRAAQIHKISVGKGNHKFEPDVTLAEIGDIIEFQFYPVNHSVVRAEYKYPCIPYEKTGRDKQGFFSGFQPVDAIFDNPPTWNLTINDTNPIFFYCSAPGSCINYGMVGVINPNASVSLATQRALAESSSFMLQPGEDFPPESSSATAVSSFTTTTSSTTTTSTTTGTAAAAAAAPHSSGLSTGAIAGIAVGGAAILALAGGLFFLWGRNRTLATHLDRQASTVATSTTYRPAPDIRASNMSGSTAIGGAGPGGLYVPYIDHLQSQQYFAEHGAGGYAKVSPVVDEYPNGTHTPTTPLGFAAVGRPLSPEVVDPYSRTTSPIASPQSQQGRRSMYSYAPDVEDRLPRRDGTGASRRSLGPHELYTPMDAGGGYRGGVGEEEAAPAYADNQGQGGAGRGNKGY